MLRLTCGEYNNKNILRNKDTTINSKKKKRAVNEFTLIGYRITINLHEYSYPERSQVTDHGITLKTRIEKSLEEAEKSWRHNNI